LKKELFFFLESSNEKEIDREIGKPLSLLSIKWLFPEFQVQEWNSWL